MCEIDMTKNIISSPDNKPKHFILSGSGCVSDYLGALLRELNQPVSLLLLKKSQPSMIRAIAIAKALLAIVSNYAVGHLRNRTAQHPTC